MVIWKKDISFYPPKLEFEKRTCQKQFSVPQIVSSNYELFLLRGQNDTVFSPIGQMASWRYNLNILPFEMNFRFNTLKTL